MSWMEIAIAVIGLVGSFIGGSALTAWINNRARRNVLQSEAAQGQAEALNATIAGAAGAIFQQMRDTMERQGEKIVELEHKVEAKDEELDELKRENEGLHRENQELRQTVASLERRIAALEER